MKQFFRYAGICVSAFIALLFLYISVPVFLNDVYVQFFGLRLYGITHPTESRLLKRVLVVDNFGLASNQCDYAAGEFRATPLPKKDVADFYAPLVNSTQSLTAKLTYEIYFAEDADEHGYLGVYEDMLQTYKQKPSSGERVYLFLIMEVHPPGPDFRCH